MHIRVLLLLVAVAALLVDQSLANGIKNNGRKKKSVHIREEKSMGRSDRSDDHDSDRSDKSDRSRSDKSDHVKDLSDKSDRSGKSDESSKSDKSDKSRREIHIREGKRRPHNQSPRIAPFNYHLEQSPVVIKGKSKAVGFDRLLKPLRFQYNPTEQYTLENNGHGFVVKFQDNIDSSVSGGPLENSYQLSSLQVKWGKNKHRGSEHRIKNHRYAAEVQLVHFNKVKYGTFDEAAKHGDGLAIVSVFVKVTCRGNYVLHLLAKNLHKIPNKSQKIELHHKINLNELLPQNYQKFWTYLGSMTQPPFTENVIWIVIRNPITFTNKELYAFRKLRPSNLRRLQPLNDRVIRASFHKPEHLGH
jgi:carbonic anhydrase